MRTVVLLAIALILGNAVCLGTCLVEDCAPPKTPSHCHQHPAPEKDAKICSHPAADQTVVVSIPVPLVVSAIADPTLAILQLAPVPVPAAFAASPPGFRPGDRLRV